MAVPKRKTSKSKRDMRKSQNMKMAAPGVSICPQCHEPKLPHRVCPNCNYYDGTSPQEQGTSSAAKYVYKILVTFAGAPVLSTEETDLSLTVGSDHALHVSVSAEDVLLDDYVSGHIVWSSSDESVVKVDANGNLTPVGEGTATVTASYGSSSTAVTVRVGGGSGDGQGGGLPGESGGQTSDNAASPKPQGVYILSGAALQRETSPAGTAAGEKMGDGSTQLELTAENNAPVALTFAVLGAFVLLGYGYGVCVYTFSVQSYMTNTPLAHS